MSAPYWKRLSGRRLLGTAFGPLLVALLAASCGGAGPTDTPVVAIAATAPDETATQVAAAGGDAALAVEAIRVQGLRADRDRIRQVIVFGDSLSDVGTYKVGAIAAIGGGKFTTNPGPVWPQTVGLLLGAPVTPFRQGYAGTSQVLGGTGFAMGGARISQQPGVDCFPDPFPAGPCTAQLTIPVSQQITDYLATNRDRFTRNQLVFVLAGANDITFQLGVLLAKLQAGVPADQATGEALAAVQQAAVDLVGQVQRMLDKGATRVVVLNMPEVADTPAGKALPAPVRQLLVGMVQLFNGTLAAGLSGSGATLLDLYAEFQRVFANPGAYHVHELNVPACDAAKIAAITNGLETAGSSLYCSRDTLVQNGAQVTYFFADGKHPTTLGHLLMARFVLIQIWKRGLL